MKNHERLYWYAVIVLCAAALFATLHLLHRQPSSQVAIVQPLPPNTTVTYVPKITEKIVAPILAPHDPADQALIAKLLKENKDYKIQVDTLTAARGELTTTGKFDMVHPETAVPVPGETIEKLIPFEVEDFRLRLKSDGQSITYVLHQNFEALMATGKSKDGKRISTVNLFEVGPNDTRNPIPVTVSEVEIDEREPRFMFGLRVHGGIALDGDKTFVAAVSWFQRGLSWDPAESRWSFLSPAVTGKGLAVIPVSYNLGSIKHQPLTNLWVGPLVGLGPAGVRSVGVAGHVQF